MVFPFSLYLFNAYLSLPFGNQKNESSALTLLLLLQPKAEQNEPPCLARLTFDTQPLGALRSMFKKWRPMENSAVICLSLIVFG